MTGQGLKNISYIYHEFISPIQLCSHAAVGGGGAAFVTSFASLAREGMSPDRDAVMEGFGT